MTRQQVAKIVELAKFHQTQEYELAKELLKAWDALNDIYSYRCHLVCCSSDDITACNCAEACARNVLPEDMK